MISTLRQFFKYEATAGFILMGAATLALYIANSPFYPQYYDFFHTPLSIQYGKIHLNQPILFWINEGLMVLFFFLIGLEIKREWLIGHLATRSQRLLPAIATLGGIVFPALIYIICNWRNPENLRGWAIPIATDIAFVLGVVALFSTSIPKSLKVLLLAVAVLDDLAAVIVIALFYTYHIAWIPLMLAMAVAIALMFANVFHITKISIYMVLGMILWALVLQSGVQPTIAGVFIAFMIPLTDPKQDISPSKLVEESLHPWVAYLILPLFAFANAGIPLKSFHYDSIMLGTMLGLFLGKQAGIFLASASAIFMGYCKLPLNATWLGFYGISVLCGIGFTMSLFIGTLAFDNETALISVKLGILMGSLLSFVLGCSILLFQRLTSNAVFVKINQ